MSVILALFVLGGVLLGNWPGGLLVGMIVVLTLNHKIYYPMWHFEPKFMFDAWSWGFSRRSVGYGVQIGWFCYTWVTFKN